MTLESPDRYTRIGPFAIVAATTYIRYHHLGTVPKLVALMFSERADGSDASVVDYVLEGSTGKPRGAVIFGMTKELLQVRSGDTVGLGADNAWKTSGYYTLHVWG